ncbi:MAG: nitroreductase family protein [Gemmatimonadota bacterium]|nr:nitroreductase family protein [Gemmatimonadota bacterium]
MSHLSRVYGLARNRQRVRRFSDRSVPAELLERVLDCGRYAPSASEDQPWRFVVVRDALARRRLAAAAFHEERARTAPVLVVGCARIHSRVSGSGRPAHPVDLAAATQAMALAAADLGLQAVWLRGYREPTVRDVIGAPPDVPVISLLAIGYPDGFDPLPARRPVEEVICRETWKEGGA